MDITGRTLSILIPYKIAKKMVFVYLQKRAKDAVRLPDWFGYFGGGADEGETPEETMLREIKEELSFVPVNYNYIGRYKLEASHGTVNDYSVYSVAVDDTFENNIKILEGDYGKFFTIDEALTEPKFIKTDKIILRDFVNKLSNN
ncbi:MAG: NUDIX hydrolase [Parcubacteria group bacterium]